MPDSRKPYTDRIQAVLDAQIRDEKGVAGNLSRIFHESPYIFLIFEDGRWAVLTLIRWALGTATEFVTETPDFSYLYDAGLLTETDEREQREHEARERERETERLELAELARLLAKYGDRREPSPTEPVEPGRVRSG